MGSEWEEKYCQWAVRFFHIAGWFFLILGSFIAFFPFDQLRADNLAVYWYSFLERWGTPLFGLAIIVWFQFPQKTWLRWTLAVLAAFYVLTMVILSFYDPLEIT